MNNINHKINSAWSKSNALYARTATQLGIGYPELMVLYALNTMDAPTQKEIAENFGLQKQTVNTVVKSLQSRGYLQLSASKKDKREKAVVLTSAGRAYAEKILAPLNAIEESVYRHIGTERLQAMCETLELVNLIFEKELDRGLTHE